MYIGILMILLFVFKVPAGIPSVSIGGAIGLIVNACMIELFYRNVFQVKLRHQGLSVWASVFVQSICFGLHFYLSDHSFIISAGAMIVGIANGLIVYKTRSIYPNFLITIIYVYIFL
ncbi:CPBP family glutamic-type intramembrane protease [Neobacillus pocheonensis]|uniref:CPBP family glutamic-type intramembrane protease n=1 Tax=Neobacillus pocheonensis TaxID=363869 RepID=A0ABT0WCH7_9BACI|nr:CPBP family glutamic-type intramembrane protease [Neobacillus pocheonensis]